MKWLEQRLGPRAKVVALGELERAELKGVEILVVEAPAAKLRDRRFVVGGSKAGCLVRRPDEIELVGSEVFAFPTGLRVFGVQGERQAFDHGGLSLQESLVPVLEVKAVEPVEKVSVSMEVPDPLTSRIAVVTLQVKELKVFQQPRRVLVQVGGRQGEAVELSMDRQQAVVQVRWLGFDDTPPSEVNVQLVDADGQHILEDRTIRAAIVI